MLVASDDSLFCASSAADAEPDAGGERADAGDADDDAGDAQRPPARRAA